MEGPHNHDIPQSLFQCHWRDVPKAAWRWPNFNVDEIACRGTGKLLVNDTALDKLQALRDRLGKPLIFRLAIAAPNTTTPSAAHPARCNSMAPPSTSPWRTTIRQHSRWRRGRSGSPGFGFHPLGLHHIDLGPARQWGDRFPVRTAAFAAESPSEREVLVDSRTMKGGGAAGVAMPGAAGVEVAQSVLAENQTAILPLVPYLDTLCWMFIAVALGGIAVTIYARLDDWSQGRRKIAVLPSGVAASRWMQVALRHGAILLAFLLLLLALRRASGTPG